ncbi:hypothetical protein D9619_011058 [Psilocybe cf. subviscida]|uniref:Uncharacterized protein n=1 Tax=Psilocybe cf. subviscida TaxID=2480587 RepID=A0A8H5BAJ8_9AGAR|nr:hypothetical protein D9619_011058 [Psilocybe cf. subviscida]
MTLQQENKMLKSGKNQDLVGKGKKKAPTEKISASNFASGLRADWGANLNLPSQETKSTPTTKNQGAAPAAKSHGGGFEDSDVEDVNPYKEVTNEERDAMDVNVDVVMNDAGKMKDVESRVRQNKLVSIVEVDDSDDDKKEFIPIIAQRHTVPAYPRKPRTVASSAQATNQLKPQNDINKAKTSGKKKSSTPAPAVVGLPGKEPEKTVKRFSSNSVRTSDLPKFAINEWRSVFLPTLYDKLFASDEPFATFFKGSQDFVSLLQLTVNEVYPFSDYQVASYDALHALAYNRINEKRSIIGSNAVQIIKSYVTRFQGEAEIMAWGRWALRTDGPLFYRVPAPANSPVDHKDPEYEPPQGRLLSQFVINLAGPFLKQTKGSQVFKSIHSQGLLALVFAALERAVKSILKPNDTLKEFSNEFWGSKVKSYQTSLRAITDARWKELFEACGVRALDDADEDLDVNMSLLDNNRALMFDFASPVRM